MSTPSCRCPIASLAVSIVVLGMPALVPAQRHPLVYAKDGSGVFGDKDTPGKPDSNEAKP